MRWQYKVSLFLLVLSQVVFFALAAYNIETRVDYPRVGPEESRTVGYSWIWYHPEQWSISLVISLTSLVVCVNGLLVDLKESGWSLSNFLNIEFEETEEKEI
jgi:hypothetical protein